MPTEFLRERFARHADAPYLIWRDEECSYASLSREVDAWNARLAEAGVSTGDVVALEADYSPQSIAALLALIERGASVVPLSRAVEARRDRLLAIAQATFDLRIDDDDVATVTARDDIADHAYYQTLRTRGHPGLVVFSSGSTGEPKGAVHDLVPILAKFHVERHRLRTIPFLLFDHLGGLNTLLYALSNGGCCVTVASRTPDDVLRAVERHRVQLLPTSPTFLNLMLLGEADQRHDLSSLETISYGTEPMPESTLQRLNARFPDAKLLQTYGLSELGVMRSRSRSSNSLWVKVGGEGFETRVVDGLLEIKARSAMLGYLNAPSPFTDDGWFQTGDEVEVDGEWLRILGRKSDLINVGGQKVFPAEVESVLMERDEVVDAAVFGVPNPILGHAVAARVAVADGVGTDGLVGTLRRHCRTRLEKFKVPVDLQLVSGLVYQERFKKSRRPS